jgi:hypothetical protein
MRADGSALAGLRVEVDTESAPYSFRTDADGNAVLVFGAIPTGLWVGDLQIPYRDSIAMLLIVAK